MLLTVHNLPPEIDYVTIKRLIKELCFTNVLLINLQTVENGSSKVTVSTADANEAAIILRKLNDLEIEGYKLKVELGHDSVKERTPSPSYEEKRRLNAIYNEYLKQIEPLNAPSPPRISSPTISSRTDNTSPVYPRRRRSRSKSPLRRRKSRSRSNHRRHSSRSRSRGSNRSCRSRNKSPYLEERLKSRRHRRSQSRHERSQSPGSSRKRPRTKSKSPRACKLDLSSKSRIKNHRNHSKSMSRSPPRIQRNSYRSNRRSASKKSEDEDLSLDKKVIIHITPSNDSERDNLVSATNDEIEWNSNLKSRDNKNCPVDESIIYTDLIGKGVELEETCTAKTNDEIIREDFERNTERILNAIANKPSTSNQVAAVMPNANLKGEALNDYTQANPRHKFYEPNRQVKRNMYDHETNANLFENFNSATEINAFSPSHSNRNVVITSNAVYQSTMIESNSEATKYMPNPTYPNNYSNIPYDQRMTPHNNHSSAGFHQNNYYPPFNDGPQMFDDRYRNVNIPNNQIIPSMTMQENFIAGHEWPPVNRHDHFRDMNYSYQHNNSHNIDLYNNYNGPPQQIIRFGNDLPSPMCVRNAGPPALRNAVPPILRNAGPLALRNAGPPILRNAGPPALKNVGPPILRNTVPPTLNNTGSPTLRNAVPPTLNNTGSPTLRNAGPPTIQNTGLHTQINHNDPVRNSENQPIRNQLTNDYANPETGQRNINMSINMKTIKKRRSRKKKFDKSSPQGQESGQSRDPINDVQLGDNTVHNYTSISNVSNTPVSTPIDPVKTVDKANFKTSQDLVPIQNQTNQDFETQTDALDSQLINENELASPIKENEAVICLPNSSSDSQTNDKDLPIIPITTTENSDKNNDFVMISRMVIPTILERKAKENNKYSAWKATQSDYFVNKKDITTESEEQYYELVMMASYKLSRTILQATPKQKPTYNEFGFLKDYIADKLDKLIKDKGSGLEQTEEAFINFFLEEHKEDTHREFMVTYYEWCSKVFYLVEDDLEWEVIVKKKSSKRPKKCSKNKKKKVRHNKSMKGQKIGNIRLERYKKTPKNPALTDETLTKTNKPLENSEASDQQNELNLESQENESLKPAIETVIEELNCQKTEVQNLISESHEINMEPQNLAISTEIEGLDKPNKELTSNNDEAMDKESFSNSMEHTALTADNCIAETIKQSSDNIPLNTASDQPNTSDMTKDSDLFEHLIFIEKAGPSNVLENNSETNIIEDKAILDKEFKTNLLNTGLEPNKVTDTSKISTSERIVYSEESITLDQSETNVDIKKEIQDNNEDIEQQYSLEHPDWPIKIETEDYVETFYQLQASDRIEMPKPISE